MRIGIDLDGVLADLVGGTIAVWNKVNPDYPLRREDWDAWDMAKKLDISGRRMKELRDTAWKDWSHMPLAEPNVAESLRRLMRAKHKVSIISNRSRETHAAVGLWLEFHMIPYHALVLNNDGPSKFDYPIDLLVDDHPDELNHVPPGKRLLIRDQPWNRDLPVPYPNGVNRTFTLEGAVERLLSPW